MHFLYEEYGIESRIYHGTHTISPSMTSFGLGLVPFQLQHLKSIIHIHDTIMPKVRQ